MELRSAVSAPRNVMVIPGDVEVAIHWEPVHGASSYNVYRSLGAANPLTLVASNLTASTFTHTGLINNRLFCFAISALKGDLEGQPSERVCAVPGRPVLDLISAGAKVEKLASGF